MPTSKDDSLWTFWSVTSCDTSGRLEGESYVNGMMPSVLFDAYTGGLLRIKTGKADNLIRNN